MQWKLELPGEGSSSPIVWEDHVLVLAAVPTSRTASAEEMTLLAEWNRDQLTTPGNRYLRFVVLDVDRQTGRVRWERTACTALPREGLHPNNTYASASPVTDGRAIYVSFGSRGIYSFDLEGNMRWKRELGTMRTRKGWGEGASPALHGDTLFVNWDHEGDSFLVTLDAATGEERWRAARDEPTSWSTPLVVEREGETQVIVSATNRIRSYDVASGNLLWQCSGLTTNVISSPILVGEWVVCMSWYGNAVVVAIPLAARGDLAAQDGIAWSQNRIAPYGPSPLLLENRIYLTRANTTIVAGLDAASGAIRLPPMRVEGLTGEIYASPVGAGDRVYYLSRSGVTAVLRAGDSADALAINRLDDQFEASPAIAGSQLLLRGRRHLYCLRELDE